MSDALQQATAQYGPNRPSRPPSNRLRKIFGYLFGGFGGILLTGSVLVFISWKPLGDPPQQSNLALAIVLLAVFIIQAVFNAWQDFSSSRVMDSITGMLPENCTVIRDGVQIQIPAVEVVPGDVLLIKAGIKLPADVRFIAVSSDAKFDRSILTGESMPIGGSTESTEDNYLETRCIGMQGTHCSSGTGRGVVVATGDSTVFGKIAKLTNRPNNTPTTLQKEILRFVLIICSLAFAFIILVIAVWAGYLRVKHPDYINVSQLIVSIVSVGIAFVPEGLPIALTASLTIVAKIMKKNNVLCKSLKTVETLGAVTVICSDKTGTLTKNVMTATDCCIATKRMTPPSALALMQDTAGSDSPRNNAIEQLRSVAALCNAGEFDVSTLDSPLKDRVIQGDATDQAVLRFSEGLGSASVTRALWRKRFDLAFNSKNKFMIRVFSLLDVAGLAVTVSQEEALDFHAENDMLLTIKGAPDVLIPRCTTYVTPAGLITPLSDSKLREIEAIKDEWSANGKRVILLARKLIPAGTMKSDPNDGSFEDETMDIARAGLTLVGLIGIVDPPRDEIPEVVKILRGAGIRIFMVTGDFKLTAQAIAQECGIITTSPALTHGVDALTGQLDEKQVEIIQSYDTDIATRQEPIKSIVLSGPELITLNDKQWSQLCTYDEIVFARTTPEQKLRIVKEFQAHDNLVAMTGDGVNDAPSLKAADIGIALGSGSDIAIEASDMVLLDSFGGIVQAVLYGRVVFDNLKKTITYLLPAGTFSEFWPVFTNVVFGLPQILSSFLMIVICCLTDCAAAITLAYEKPEADVMLRPPRRPKKEKLVDWRLLLQAYIVIGGIECVSSFSMAYWFCERRGVPFSVLWFGYGKYPGLDPEHVQSVLNQASSIYFVNLVVMYVFHILPDGYRVWLTSTGNGSTSSRSAHAASPSSNTLRSSTSILKTGISSPLSRSRLPSSLSSAMFLVWKMFFKVRRCPRSISFCQWHSEWECCCWMKGGSGVLGDGRRVCWLKWLGEESWKYGNVRRVRVLMKMILYIYTTRNHSLFGHLIILASEKIKPPLDDVLAHTRTDGVIPSLPTRIHILHELVNRQSGIVLLLLVVIWILALPM